MHLGGPYDFTSAWMSAGAGEEWVYVDLGVEVPVRPRVAHLDPPRRGRRAAGLRRRRELDRPCTRSMRRHQAEPSPPNARYVRVLMTKAAAPEGYILSELEVYGRGGLAVQPKPAAPGLALAAAPGKCSAIRW